MKLRAIYVVWEGANEYGTARGRERSGPVKTGFNLGRENKSRWLDADGLDALT